MKWGFNRDAEGFLLCITLPVVTTVINPHHDPSFLCPKVRGLTPQTNLSIIYHVFLPQYCLKIHKSLVDPRGGAGMHAPPPKCLPFHAFWEGKLAK